MSPSVRLNAEVSSGRRIRDYISQSRASIPIGICNSAIWMSRTAAMEIWRIMLRMLLKFASYKNPKLQVFYQYYVFCMSGRS